MVEPNDELLRIGQVVELSGTPATTIRYYEQLGLLVAATRVGGQRRFHASVIATLMVIRFCRVAGLSLEDVAIVLDDRSPGRASTRDVAARQIERIDAQVAELALARSMMVAAASCTCPTVERCECGRMDDVLVRLRRHLEDSGRA